MSLGDVINPKRVRVQANERLDTVDVDAVSLVPREHLDAYSRAVEATPRNVGSTTPTGLIFQGFGLTLNPTGPSDNKVRVQAALGVAFDANGRLLIKENGVTVDLTLPSGNSQIYTYYIEDSSDTAVRRTIGVSSPFTEGGLSFATKFKGDVAFFVRAGDQTSIVASDVVNGTTTALCFLGVANNAAGTVTMTGYNSVTAPNGAFATNRITSVVTPTTLPVLSTNNGSVATIHGLVNAALFMVGQAIWKGSKNFTPTAANNFGAYSPPAVGIDGLFDSQAETTFSSTTRWRDWQQNTRFLVDHQGFPGGTISVKDEHWVVPARAVLHFDPTTGYKIAGSPAQQIVSPFGVTLAATNDNWFVPIAVPIGAVITSLFVFYISTNAGNQLNAALEVTNLASGLTAAQVIRIVTTTPANTHLASDIMVTPSSGHGPKMSRVSEKLGVAVDASSIVAGTIIVYDIQATCTLLPAGWTPFLNTVDLLTNGDAIVVSDPIAGFNQRHVQLTAVPSGGTSGLAELDSTLEVFVDSDLAHSTEFMVRTGTVVDGGNTASFVAQFITQSNGQWGLERQAGNANWKLRLVDDVNSQLIDTGVAFSSNTVYRIKYEFQGANRNSSGAARTRMWINGTLVATATALSTLSADVAGMTLILGAGVGGGPYDIRVGRVHRAWNHVAAGDNV